MRVASRRGDDLCQIAGAGCPYTLPIAGRPLVSHAVRALCDAGIEQILVAIDATVADEVAPLISEITGAEIHAAIQPEHDDDATMRAVEKVLGPGPLVYTSGDALSTVDLDGVTPKQDMVLGARVIWAYDGTVDGALEGNTLALDSMKRGRIGVDLSNANVQGRVYIDPSAELDGAKIRGPVSIGPGARLVETYVGPYTTIAEGVCLEGVEIENSIVMREAQIRYPGQRLEGSLVGEGAEIARDYSLPSAVRVRVGPGSQIQLS